MSYRQSVDTAHLKRPPPTKVVWLVTAPTEPHSFQHAQTAFEAWQKSCFKTHFSGCTIVQARE